MFNDGCYNQMMKRTIADLYFGFHCLICYFYNVCLYHFFVWPQALMNFVTFCFPFSDFYSISVLCVFIWVNKIILLTHSKGCEVINSHIAVKHNLSFIIIKVNTSRLCFFQSLYFQHNKLFIHISNYYYFYHILLFR